MSDILFTYLNNRLHERKGKKADPAREPGPVLTISRESGCNATKFTEKLNNEINLIATNGGNGNKWKIISKEILEEAAKELQVKPSEIEYIFRYQERTIIGDVLASFASKYYKSEKKIRNTIADVIRSISAEGNVIILGRAGGVLTKDFLRSLHVKLEAPLQWRTIMISQRSGLPMKDARKFAVDMDKKRERFRNSFEGRNTDYTWADISFNRMGLTDEEIISGIICMMRQKKLFDQ